MLDENEDKTFYVLGYYQAYSQEGSQLRTASGLSDDIMVKIGRIKDYESLGYASYLGSMTGVLMALTSLLLTA